jgi:DNA polymerase III delta prime subunit
MNNSIQHPTQLWISDQQTLEKKMIEHLQEKLCKNNGCTSCTTCTQIATKDHPWVIWTTPERSYTLEQIDEIMNLSAFTLDEGEQRFFILPQAERLTEQCSNRLLKTIEEPFAGYNFFFLTSRAQALPLTIQSRCVISRFKATTNFEIYKEFLQPFLSLQFNQPISFIKQLETLDIKEQETKELIDDLYEHWSDILKQEIADKDTASTVIHNLVAVLQQAINNPPMTGSAKIFWKNLYITAHYATTSAKNQN